MAPRPSAPRQRHRYTKILEAAGGFARKGLDSVDMSEVAARADVPLGTLYRYFPSPAHLMLALYRHQLEELQGTGQATAARFRERLGPPLPPVDRVLPVLEQIRGRRACQTVDHGGGSFRHGDQ